MPLLYVPTIDFNPYLDASAAGKTQVAAQIAQACIDIGFLIVTNHGVARELTENVMSVAKNFFALTLEEKMQVARPAPHLPRGYSPIANESVSFGSSRTMTPGDLKESLDIGPIDVPGQGPYYTCAEGQIHFAPNNWPKRPTELETLWTDYYQAMDKLSRQLMRVFALGLNIDEFFFDNKIDKHITVLRAINYPAQPEPPAPGRLRAGAHSDYGSLTVLRAEDAPGGLQVKNANGEWTDVPFVEDSFIVNLGDLMMRWTNDLWRSTEHRVVNPLRNDAASSRLSLVYFHQPNYDALAECIATCQNADNPPKYEPITSGDHLLSNFTKQITFAEQPE
jgi:isopenicillin N synthase-like dioxygenase